MFVCESRLAFASIWSWYCCRCSVVLSIAEASRDLPYFVSTRWRSHCFRLLNCCFMEAPETHPSLGMWICLPCARHWRECGLRDLCSWSLLCVYRLSIYCCVTSHYHAVSLFCFFFVFFFGFSSYNACPPLFPSIIVCVFFFIICPHVLVRYYSLASFLHWSLFIFWCASVVCRQLPHIFVLFFFFVCGVCISHVYIKHVRARPCLFVVWAETKVDGLPPAARLRQHGNVHVCIDK